MVAATPRHSLHHLGVVLASNTLCFGNLGSINLLDDDFTPTVTETSHIEEFQGSNHTTTINGSQQTNKKTIQP